MTRNERLRTAALVVALVAALLAAITYERADAFILEAFTWLAVAVAALAAGALSS